MTSLALDYRSPRVRAVTVAFIVVVVAVGALIGISAAPDAWYEALRKAPWNPPNWLFAPAWFALYVLIGIAGARTFLRDPASPAMLVWILQMVLNWAWSPTSFRLHMLWPALAIIVVILALIAAFVGTAWRTDRLSAWLFVPYGLWVAFATTLNAAITVLN
jgi:tryptophan-rich sensory protein